MSVRFRLPAAVAALTLSLGLVAAPAPVASAAQDCSSTDQYYVNNHRISAWSERFNGWQCRTWDNSASWLWINLGQNSGAYDAGIGKNTGGKRVDSQAVGIGTYVKMTVNVSGSGHYWAGPKTIISSTQNYSGLVGENECYIVDKAKWSPQDLANWANLTYRGQGTYDGSVYKHYTVNYQGINQIWSIRQNYRSEGWTSVGYILRDWRRLGLCANNYNLGWKMNVETNGQVNGEIGFSHLSLPWN